MAMGDALARRAAELAKRQPQIQTRFVDVARGATIRAVEEATAKTAAPNDGKLRGTNMISGELAQHWDNDSIKEPEVVGNRYTTVLHNDKNYASYVNDGHDLRKHFVPGLYIDKATGLLSRNSDDSDGLMVGTKTSHVDGLYMKEAAIEKYEEVADKELRKLAEEMLS